MKILWFTNTPSLYKNDSTGYNGGGWIESLEQIVSGEKDIELAISFFHHDDCFKSKQGETTYYPLSLYNSTLKKIKHNLLYKSCDNREVKAFMEVVDDFKPDLIHIFGSERSFGLIVTQTNIPVILHVQGILNPCLNAYYIPGSSKFDFITQYFFNPIKLINTLHNLSIFSTCARREEHIFKNCSYFMGRTAWDKDIISLYAPKAKYFYCSEVLRDVFYKLTPWQVKMRDNIIIVSTISKTSYKGFDLILKTAQLLKQLTNLSFEWLVYGIDEYRECERKLQINCKDVNIFLKGVADSKTLAENVLKADLFVHPSYIDNSPNSICEAQILGIPVVSTNVGGISSLIENGETGYLIPANDPYTLAVKIVEISKNHEKAAEIGTNARVTAQARHDKGIIKNDLLKIYNECNDAKNTNKIM